MVTGFPSGRMPVLPDSIVSQPRLIRSHRPEVRSSGTTPSIALFRGRDPQTHSIMPLDLARLRADHNRANLCVRCLGLTHPSLIYFCAINTLQLLLWVPPPHPCIDSGAVNIYVALNNLRSYQVACETNPYAGSCLAQTFRRLPLQYRYYYHLLTVKHPDLNRDFRLVRLLFTPGSECILCALSL
jgi:hypothetical protein